MSKILFVFTLGLAGAVFSGSVAHGQMQSDGKWKFPDSVRALCIDLEQGMVATFRALIENNRKMVAAQDQSERTTLMSYSDAHKRALVESEERWSRLGCVALLYASPQERRVAR